MKLDSKVSVLLILISQLKSLGVNTNDQIAVSNAFTSICQNMDNLMTIFNILTPHFISLNDLIKYLLDPKTVLEVVNFNK